MATFLETCRAGIQMQVYLPPHPMFFFSTADCFLGYIWDLFAPLSFLSTTTTSAVTSSHRFASYI